MVRELSAKHLAAINRGRKAAGLKPIRMKKKTTKTNNSKSKKALTKWQEAKKRFKGDKMGLIEYYYSVPFRLRKSYGMPKIIN